MNAKSLTFLLLMAFCSVAIGQTFVSPADGFSHKKTTYVTMDDGTQYVGTIKDLDRKKGLIEEIKLELTDGKKIKLDPEEIKFAYLPPSGFDKLSRTLDATFDATQWESRDIDGEIISQGYAYFQKTEVRIKNKTRTLLLQIMNPQFADHVKVFYDPFARETMSVGVAGITVAGGLDKSYYLKLGDDIAYRVKKKDYDEEFKLIFEGCDAVLTHEDAGTWNQFEAHTWMYSQECGEE